MTRQDGAAVVLCLVVMICVSGIGLGMLAAGAAEREIAGNARGSAAIAFAAGAAIEGVFSEIANAPDWSPLLAGSVTSAFSGGAHRVTTPSQRVVDLDQVTADLRADAAGAYPVGPDIPNWRLFAWTTLSNLAGLPAPASGAYVAVWVADDPADNDGDAAADANGVIMVHSEAFGFGGTRASADAALERGPTGARVLSWRSR